MECLHVDGQALLRLLVDHVQWLQHPSAGGLDELEVESPDHVGPDRPMAAVAARLQPRRGRCRGSPSVAGVIGGIISVWGILQHQCVSWDCGSSSGRRSANGAMDLSDRHFRLAYLGRIGASRSCNPAHVGTSVDWTNWVRTLRIHPRPQAGGAHVTVVGSNSRACGLME